MLRVDVAPSTVAGGATVSGEQSPPAAARRRPDVERRRLDADEAAAAASTAGRAAPAGPTQRDAEPLPGDAVEEEVDRVVDVEDLKRAGKTVTRG